MTTFFIILFIALIIFIITRKLPPETYSNWNQLIDGMSYSTMDFYDTLEKALNSHGIDDIKMKRVNLSERGMLSSKREYLRVVRKDLTHDIGAFPFDGGFYVTSWQYKQITGTEEIVRKIPFAGPILQQAFWPETYYTVDTAAMYRSYVHHSLLEVIDMICETQSLRKLSEAERTPQLKDIFKRK